jgi:putative membrane protein
MMGSYGPGLNWIDGLFLILMLVFAALVTGFILYAMSRMGMNQSTQNQTPPRTALDICKERYAKGEIDEDEFKRMKNNLS